MFDIKRGGTSLRMGYLRVEQDGVKKKDQERGYGTRKEAKKDTYFLLLLISYPYRKFY